MRRPQKKKPLLKAPVTARMPEERIDFYRYIVQRDFSGNFVPEENAHLWSGGLARVRDLNDTLRSIFKLVKEHSAQRLEEYKAKGYLEYCPSEANLPHSSQDLIGEGNK